MEIFLFAFALLKSTIIKSLDKAPTFKFSHGYCQTFFFLTQNQYFNNQCPNIVCYLSSKTCDARVILKSEINAIQFITREFSPSHSKNNFVWYSTFILFALYLQHFNTHPRHNYNECKIYNVYLYINLML